MSNIWNRIYLGYNLRKIILFAWKMSKKCIRDGYPHQQSPCEKGNSYDREREQHGNGTSWNAFDLAQNAYPVVSWHKYIFVECHCDAFSQRESAKMKTFPLHFCSFIHSIPFRSVQRILKILYFPCHYLRLHERQEYVENTISAITSKVQQLVNTMRCDSVRCNSMEWEQHRIIVK